MILTTGQSILLIAAAAVATFATRLLPYLFFGGRRKVPGVIEYLGRVLPPAIIITLVVYCVKDVDFTAVWHGAPELIAIAATALLHMWRKNTLISIAAGTVLYMVLIHVMV